MHRLMLSAELRSCRVGRYPAVEPMETRRDGAIPFSLFVDINNLKKPSALPESIPGVAYGQSQVEVIG
ncbi:hypothetical protein N7507_005833 [Penicillium longicatenatum]|nr:hypothetical protein N7507_005833 [Penicillium longicatenatum]